MNMIDDDISRARSRPSWEETSLPGTLIDSIAPEEAHPTSKPQVDFRQIWSALYRNRWLIGATTLLAVLIGAAVTFLMTPIYKATASLQIEQQEQDVLQGNESKVAIPVQDADRFLQTQVDIIRSRYLSEQVARDMNLFANRDFFASMGASISDEEWGNRDERREAVISLLQRNLHVNLPMDSRIAEIAFRSPDPALAARVANEFADDAITANLRRKFDQSSYARDFLQKQLAVAQRRLEESERALVGYARRSRIIDTSGGVASGREQQASVPRSITTASLVQLNNELASAVANRTAAEAQWNAARSSAPMNLPQVLQNQAVQELVQARAAARASYNQQLQRFDPEYPTMKQAAAQIRELDKQVNALASHIRNGIRQEYLSAKRREDSLSARVENLKAQTLSEQDRSVRYNILRRDVDSNRGMYEALLQRFREVSAQSGVTANNITLLDRADVPLDPVLPKPFINLALAGFGGFALGLLLTFLRERVDDIIRSPSDAEEKLGLYSLAAIPIDEAPLESLADTKSAVSEAYFGLRTSLELASSGGVPKSIMFTSSQPAEGKSTTSFAVARSFASLGRKVLLVDADLRKPSVHRQVGTENVKGLSDLLSDRAQLDNVLQREVMPRLDVITAGPQPPNPTELLGGLRWDQLLETLSDNYDMVVIDAPPVMGLADAPLLASRVAAAVFVIEANRAHHGQAKLALRRLQSVRANVLGVVLTKFDAKQLGYRSYGAYGYGYGYGAEASTSKND